MSTKSLSRRFHGHRTKALARSHSIRALKRSRLRSGPLRLSILKDLYLIERYALIFFSKCQYPALCRKNYARESKQGRRYGILKSPTPPTYGSTSKIASLGRYGAMTAWCVAERLRSTTLLRREL